MLSKNIFQGSLPQVSLSRWHRRVPTDYFLFSPSEFIACFGWCWKCLKQKERESAGWVQRACASLFTLSKGCGWLSLRGLLGLLAQRKRRKWIQAQFSGNSPFNREPWVMLGRDTPSNQIWVSINIEYVSARREVLPCTAFDTEFHCGCLVKEDFVCDALPSPARKHLFLLSLQYVPSTTAATEIVLKHDFNQVSSQINICDTYGVKQTSQPLQCGLNLSPIPPWCGPDSCTHCPRNSSWALAPLHPSLFFILHQECPLLPLGNSPNPLLIPSAFFHLKLRTLIMFCLGVKILCKNFLFFSFYQLSDC